MAEELVLFESRDAELLLLSLLSDDNELVRVNACDSLCIGKSMESINALKERAKKDKSSLVRRYAALSIADIAKNINLVDTQELIDFYETLLEKEKVTGVKICIYEALVKLGVGKYLDLILKELENRLYRNRSTAVHSLTELISKENETEIKNILRRRLSTEKTKAVKSAIEEVLSK